jgi:saccharopine dehydrogenase (NAD+, L-lysine-forming)
VVNAIFMCKVVIIGAGGVGNVVVHKCVQLPEVFSEIVLASRTLSKCEEIAAQAGGNIRCVAVDADDIEALTTFLKTEKPRLVIHVALPYQDLSIMEACLRSGVDYVDTANYEHPELAKFEYKEQWAFHDRYVAAGRTALLGSGFDPGVTNVYCAYAQKHLFDEIHTVDIIDANAGDHGYPFATNFNPEINIREITANGRYWENGEWKETAPLSVHKTFSFPHPEVGDREIYLLYHEELESLVRHIKGLKRIRFWMTFSQNYLTHLKVLENVGMTRIDPIDYEGKEVIPLQFLKKLLPDPASLGPRTKGKTCIGNVMTGIKDGKPRRVYIYNICDHQEAYRETGAQAISYTTGVPAMIGAKMMVEGHWQGPGVFNIEQFNPDPFMDDLNKYGLPWEMIELDPEAAE